MITPASLAMLRFGFHGGGGFAFVLLFVVAAALVVWVLTRSGRNSA
jgi:hypothetical protein